jgi:hypothetical protein
LKKEAKILRFGAAIHYPVAESSNGICCFEMATSSLKRALASEMLTVII